MSFLIQDSRKARYKFTKKLISLLDISILITYFLNYRIFESPVCGAALWVVVKGAPNMPYISKITTKSLFNRRSAPCNNQFLFVSWRMHFKKSRHLFLPILNVTRRLVTVNLTTTDAFQSCHLNNFGIISLRKLLQLKGRSRNGEDDRAEESHLETKMHRLDSHKQKWIYNVRALSAKRSCYQTIWVKTFQTWADNAIHPFTFSFGNVSYLTDDQQQKKKKPR